MVQKAWWHDQDSIWPVTLIVRKQSMKRNRSLVQKPQSPCCDPLPPAMLLEVLHHSETVVPAGLKPHEPMGGHCTFNLEIK